MRLDRCDRHAHHARAANLLHGLAGRSFARTIDESSQALDRMGKSMIVLSVLFDAPPRSRADLEMN